MEESKSPFIFGYVLSLFSPRFYDQVARLWKGAAIGYAALLVLVYWVCFMVVTSPRLAEIKPMIEAGMPAGFPSLTYENGALSSSREEPFRFEEGGEKLLLIDTGNQVSDEERQGFEIVLTDTEMIVPSEATSTSLQDLADAGLLTTGTMTPTDWVAYLDETLTWLYWLAMPFLFVFHFIFILVGALVLSLMALLINAILKKDLEYPALYRLSIVAATPAYLFSLVAMVLSLTMAVSVFNLVGLLIHAAYTIFAVSSVRSRQPPPVQMGPLGLP
ncbi:MAG: DUF1189 family protein [Verrucomicrobiota bacterium]